MSEVASRPSIDVTCIWSVTYTCTTNNHKGREMDVKKGGGDETRPTGYPLMEVVHMHRFWTFLT